MTIPIGQVVFEFNQAREDYDIAREHLIAKAIELGAHEKMVNSDQRVAMAYLVGYKKGKQ